MLTVDRFAEKYSGLSAYSYGANNPIKYIDVNGDSLWITQRTGFLGLGGKQTLRYENGNLYNKDGSGYTGELKGFTSKAFDALNSLNSVSEGASRLRKLESSPNDFTIKRGKNEFIPSSINRAALALNAQVSGRSIPAGAVPGSGGVIKWSPGSSRGGLNTSGNTERPSFIGLGHELLGHAFSANQGMADYRTHSSGLFSMDEFNASHAENLIRAQWHLPLRSSYGTDGTGPLIKSGSGIFNSFNYNSQTGSYYDQINYQQHYFGSNSGR